jgi:hypothetical protein
MVGTPPREHTHDIMFTARAETALHTGQGERVGPMTYPSVTDITPRPEPVTPDPNASTSASEHPTSGEMLAEIIPLIGAIAGYGPPVIFLAGPWLLLGLMLSGPFAFLVILVLFMLVAATVLVAVTAGILAILTAPYLLVRHLRRHRARHASISAPTVQVGAIESPRVAA